MVSAWRVSRCLAGIVRKYWGAGVGKESRKEKKGTHSFGPRDAGGMLIYTSAQRKRRPRSEKTVIVLLPAEARRRRVACGQGAHLGGAISLEKGIMRCWKLDTVFYDRALIPG